MKKLLTFTGLVALIVGAALWIDREGWGVTNTVLFVGGIISLVTYALNME